MNDPIPSTDLSPEEQKVELKIQQALWDAFIDSAPPITDEQEAKTRRFFEDYFQRRANGAKSALAVPTLTSDIAQNPNTRKRFYMLTLLAASVVLPLIVTWAMISIRKDQNNHHVLNSIHMEWVSANQVMGAKAIDPDDVLNQINLQLPANLIGRITFIERWSDNTFVLRPDFSQEWQEIITGAKPQLKTFDLVFARDTKETATVFAVVTNTDALAILKNFIKNQGPSLAIQSDDQIAVRLQDELSHSGLRVYGLGWLILSPSQQKGN